MKKHLLIFTLILVGCCKFATAAEKISTTLPQDESYVLGQMLSDYMIKSNFHLLPDFDEDAFLQGVKDVLKKQRPKYGYVSSRSVRESIQNRIATAKKEQRLETAKYVKNPDSFFAVNRLRSHVTELPGGVQYEVIKFGEGASPTLENKVMLRFKSRTLDGNVFVSSLTDKHFALKPIAMTDLMAGWQDALQQMQIGDRWRLYIPPEKAFGKHGNKKFDVDPGEAIISELELLDVFSDKP